MANDEHLALLRQGTRIWNEWRLRNRDIRPDLAGADLREADLTGADLTGAFVLDAKLIEANLSKTNLSKADLTGADLGWANLSGANLSNAVFFRAQIDAANLSGANLSGAYVIGANFRGTILRKADFSRALFFETILANLDLRETIGLTVCKHLGPSVIDFRTLQLSENLPISFLRGCGLPDNLIDYLPSLRGGPIKFYSCFISYSAKDQMFADRLYADLQNKGVRCWFAPHNLRVGDKILDAIDEAIRLRDKLLVILSEASIASDWVEDEVTNAYEEERQRKVTLLFPIRIDDAVRNTNKPWARKLRARHIGDFRRWNDAAEYQKSFDRLLRDLKTSGAK